MSEAKEAKAGDKAEVKAEAKAPKAKKTPADSARDTQKAKQKWTAERCKRVAKRFATVDEWHFGAPSSYKAAVAKGWISECSVHMKGGKVSSVKQSTPKSPSPSKRSA